MLVMVTQFMVNPISSEDIQVTVAPAFMLHRIVFMSAQYREDNNGLYQGIFFRIGRCQLCHDFPYSPQKIWLACDARLYLRCQPHTARMLVMVTRFMVNPIISEDIQVYSGTCFYAPQNCVPVYTV